jgi:hypothetical protein
MASRQRLARLTLSYGTTVGPTASFEQTRAGGMALFAKGQTVGAVVQSETGTAFQAQVLGGVDASNVAVGGYVGNGTGVKGSTAQGIGVHALSNGTVGIPLVIQADTYEADPDLMQAKNDEGIMFKIFNGGALWFATAIAKALTRANLRGATVALTGTNIDWNLSDSFSLVLSANTTLTFSNAADGQVINLAVRNPSTFTLALPGAVQWSGGAQPPQTTGNKTDVWTFMKQGAVLRGSVVQNFPGV